MWKKWICQEELFSGARCGSGHCPPRGRAQRGDGDPQLHPAHGHVAGTRRRAGCGAFGIAWSQRRQHSPSGLAASLGTSRANKSPLRGSFQAVLCSLPQRLLSPFSCFSQYFSLSLHFSAEGHLCRARGSQRRGHGQAQPLFKVARCWEEQGAPGTPQRPALRTGSSPKGFPTLSSSHWTKPPGASPGVCTVHFRYNVPDVGRNQDHSRGHQQLIQHEEPWEGQCRQGPSPTHPGTLTGALAGPSSAV